MLIYPEKNDGIIYRRKDDIFGYNGWPSICKADDGTLFAVCSGGRIAHVCPFGKTLLFRSTDGGKNWSVPSVINDTPLDDRDAGILSTGKNRLLVSWFTHPSELYNTSYKEGILSSYSDKNVKSILEAKLDYIKKYDGRKDLVGSFVRTSDDGGFTWGKTVKLPVSAPHGPIMLSDGSLFYIGCAMYTDELPDDTIAVYKSSDGGASWYRHSVIDTLKPEAGEGYFEPHAAELRDGRIMAGIRAHLTSGKERFTVVTVFSSDGGKTWSEPHETGMCGSPPHFLRHSSGAVICSVGRRKEPFGECAYISYDEGETWEDEYVLREDGFNGDLGYPASAELPDGSIITVYYQLYSPDDNEKRSVLYTHWKLKNKT